MIDYKSLRSPDPFPGTAVIPNIARACSPCLSALFLFPVPDPGQNAAQSEAKSKLFLSQSGCFPIIFHKFSDLIYTDNYISKMVYR